MYREQGDILPPPHGTNTSCSVVEIPADITSIRFEVPSGTNRAVMITPGGNVIEVC